ncbi:ATP-binding protein [Aestuariivirga litoralis]|uniref:ATP-binding protein n=1 Tax=Aestuariivirga litoralis TaxID=2650924 RepID=UPI0018C612C2|nr:ATP-binding protein [Aestuariivirga litoralis]
MHAEPVLTSTEAPLPLGLWLPITALSVAAAILAVMAGILLMHDESLALVRIAACLSLGMVMALVFLLRSGHAMRNAAAELALHEKSHRLATMSHELRTPLNGIIGMLSLLSETGLTAHQSNFAETAQSSARALLSTIDEILNTAKAETHAKERALLDPVALVESVTELLAPRAHAKGIEISARVAASVPAEIIADELKLRQLLFNLAGNAIKFTEKGGVSITLSMAPHDRLQIEVKDTGIGMSEEEQARIFEPFVQANAQTQRKFGGTGLGLAISRKLVEFLGGSINVASKLGEGTLFTLLLPVKSIAGQDAPRNSLESRHYLLAMQEGFSRAHLAETLAELGAKVSFIATRAELAKALKSTNPLQHVICASPHFAQLHAWARSKRRGPAHVWVMLKAEERHAHPDLLKAPFAGYLLNPLRRSTLLGRLAAHNGKALKQTSATLRKAKPAPPTQPSLALSVLLAEDNAVNALLSRTQLERLGHRVTHVADGKIALDVLHSQLHFDIALLDVEMPHFTGHDVARALRNEPGLQHRRSLPILALTANARDEDVRACRNAGMDDHLAKPFDRLDLEEKINALFKASGQKAA